MLEVQMEAGVAKPARVRDSGIELFRIITMLVIVAHHYVVNSGLTGVINANPLTANSVFLLLFGWGGKTGINCFVLITGYFMCRSDITLKKFLKLVLEVEFYYVVIYLLFALTGYIDFSAKGFLKAAIPFRSIGGGFTNSYLVFYLFIPFLNILIRGMDEKTHLKLIGLCLLVYTVLPTFMRASVVLSYVSWFMVLYIIAAYIRLYPKRNFENRRIWGIAALGMLLLSWASVLVCAWVGRLFGMQLQYTFVADSNKLLALATAVCAFMYFKNLHIGYSKCINTIAASAFGVLLIHANSDTMRQWLWQDVCNNAGQYGSGLLVVHAFGVVAAVYAVCTAIDWCRIQFLERPFFKAFDRHCVYKSFL